MDVHSAKKSVEKLLAYVEEVSSNESKLYTKSRDRLREIADNCNQVVALISDILQEEILKDDSDEFGESSSTISDVLDDMEYQITKVQDFTRGSAESQRSETSALLQASETTASQTALSINLRRKVFANYTECLAQLPAASKSGPIYAQRCASLLWTWFETRFHKTITGSTFKYSMRKFPEWVQGVVVMYGKAIHDNSVASFEFEFQNWIDSLATTDAKNKYVVPYPVYQFCKNHSPQDMTLDAVVLWDILLDKGLDKLCTDNKQDLYLDQYSIYNLCNSLNPVLLDNYQDYANHPEIFTTLGWEV